MSELLLTFELSEPGNTLEIHMNEEGLSLLIDRLQRIPKHDGHDHLMTAKWGGRELSEETQGKNNQLIDHVKIILWT